MTKVTDSANKSRQGSAEAEITPEMVEAGVSELLSHDSEDFHLTDPRLVVCGIFSAMISRKT